MMIDSKLDKEEVWPEDVENAFMKAMAIIPKLGRRKLTINGKACGRNELVGAFIQKRTGKKRSRKQISSHIQVLKQTCKDPHTLKLLSDSPIDDGSTPMALEDVLAQCQITYNSACEPPLRISSDWSPRGSLPSSPTSPRGISPLSISPHDIPSHRRELSIASMLNPEPAPKKSCTATSAASSGLHRKGLGLASICTRPALLHRQTHPTVTSRSLALPPPPRSAETVLLSRGIDRRHPSQETRDLFYQSEMAPFWPCQYLFLQGHPSLEHGLYASQVESVLAECIHPYDDSLPAVDICSLHSQRYSILQDLYDRKSCLFLRYHMGLNVYHPEGRLSRLETSNIFQSTARRTVECTTTVFSFGQRAIVARELQQAAFHHDRYVYSFKMVNEWLQSFLQGLEHMRPSEVQAALENLIILQEFDSIEDETVDAPPSRHSVKSTPLLVVCHEFSPGQGSIVGSKLSGTLVNTSTTSPRRWGHSSQSSQSSSTWSSSSMPSPPMLTSPSPALPALCRTSSPPSPALHYSPPSRPSLPPISGHFRDVWADHPIPKTEASSPPAPEPLNPHWQSGPRRTSVHSPMRYSPYSSDASRPY